MSLYRRLTHGRYRIIYRVHKDSTVTVVHFIAMRKEGDQHDPYQAFASLAKKWHGKTGRRTP
jgi:hypothetical protein